MSKFDGIKVTKDAPCEERLAILQAEMVRCIYVISGYAVLLKHRVMPEQISALPEDYGEWVDKIIEATDDLKALRDMLI